MHLAGRSKANRRSIGDIIKRDFLQNKYVYLMALPIFLYYVIFHYIPMGGNIIAFQNYVPIKGFFKSDWVGIKHFVDFFSGPYAWRVIRNTLLLNVYDIIFGFPTSIILALVINEVKNATFKKVSQTISYMPHFVSLVVMCGIIVDFSRTNGLFSTVLANFGVEPTNLLTEQQYFRPIFVGSGIWKSMGWGSIIYLSTLSSVDPTLYEASAIDGAGRIRQMINITFPSLVPVLTIQLIMRIGNIMSQGFEKVILLYNPLVYETADVISSYVYRRGLEETNYSVGSAIGLFNALINVIILVSANSACKKWIKESLW